MQVIADMEAVCERAVLARAEARQARDDQEPTARECFEECIHSKACMRMFEHYAYNVETDEAIDLMVMEIGCGEDCQEYEE